MFSAFLGFRHASDYRNCHHTSQAKQPRLREAFVSKAFCIPVRTDLVAIQRATHHPVLDRVRAQLCVSCVPGRAASTRSGRLGIHQEHWGDVDAPLPSAAPRPACPRSRCGWHTTRPWDLTAPASPRKAPRQGRATAVQSRAAAATHAIASVVGPIALHRNARALHRMLVWHKFLVQVPRAKNIPHKLLESATVADVPSSRDAACYAARPDDCRQSA